MGKHLRDARKRLKLNQADVAHMTNISLPYYGKLERGELRPSIDRLVRICNALNISLPDAFKGACPPETSYQEATPAREDFEHFFMYLADRVSDETIAVMMEVCKQIASLNE